MTPRDASISFDRVKVSHACQTSTMQQLLQIYIYIYTHIHVYESSSRSYHRFTHDFWEKEIFDCVSLSLDEYISMCIYIYIYIGSCVNYTM